ncbi:hypothetical protein NKR23_g513 [Pleurostoma richardsiae]|uniref:Ribosome maturation protein SDO1/SBDS N-terminal domain-containing protein n=1 Tax=Pleurostoma richardsiae TaxID=41990 RepID=A0AA38VR23_9PEZI|nr:hypothetical protein NKR23_g513 [Pleurostoma richardsiae]
MARGGAEQIKLHFKGKSDDFLVFLDDVETYKKWLNDKSIPLTQFVSSFEVFVTHKQGAQGTFDQASKASLDNEFGTHNDDEVIKKILETGSLQESHLVERQGNRNDSNGGLLAA